MWPGNIGLNLGGCDVSLRMRSFSSWLQHFFSSQMPLAGTELWECTQLLSHTFSWNLQAFNLMPPSLETLQVAPSLKIARAAGMARGGALWTTSMWKDSTVQSVVQDGMEATACVSRPSTVPAPVHTVWKPELAAKAYVLGSWVLWTACGPGLSR